MTDITRRKRLLFVDDDAAFLGAIRELFSALSKGSWEISLAENHAQGLAEIQRQRPDLVVLDIGMPVMDGLQFQRLLGKTHPDLQIAMLTGNVSDENRKTALAAGAVLFLQKPTVQGEFSAIFSALDALAGAQPQEGFKGMLRRIGLHEVLQFECLGRRSSVLEIFTGKVRGRIYIEDGSIIHAESGSVKGEVALYSLLALRGGEFNLLVFSQPPQRTIEGNWEMLLMEAARLSDEAAQPTSEGGAEATEASAPPAKPLSLDDIPNLFPTFKPGPATEAPEPEPTAPEVPVKLSEVLLCSGAGEVLYEWECPSVERRLNLLRQIEEQGTQFSGLGPVGRFDRVEIYTGQERLVCHIHPQRRMLVRRENEGGTP